MNADPGQTTDHDALHFACAFCGEDMAGGLGVALADVETVDGWRKQVQCHCCGGSGPIAINAQEAWRIWDVVCERNMLAVAAMVGAPVAASGRDEQDEQDGGSGDD